MPPKLCHGYPSVGKGKGKRKISTEWLTSEPKCRNNLRARRYLEDGVAYAAAMPASPLCYECRRSAVAHWDQLRPWLEEQHGALSDGFVSYMERKAGQKVRPLCQTASAVRFQVPVR